MPSPELRRGSFGGVALTGDERRPFGVTLMFTERAGGVSRGPHASLNLGDGRADDPSSVRENRRRALAAVGAAHLAARLVKPRQVHGTHVAVVDASGGERLAAALDDAHAGADAVVCTATDVPVLLCFADCVPVVLVCDGGFAVIHSGWRSTMGHITAKALATLCDLTGAQPQGVLAYVGPHIGGDDYEVSRDLATRFEGEFGPRVLRDERHLDLSAAIRADLERAGVAFGQVLDALPSTLSATDRYFSYRAQGEAHGLHGALAIRAGEATYGDDITWEGAHLSVAKETGRR